MRSFSRTNLFTAALASAVLCSACANVAGGGSSGSGGSAGSAGEGGAWGGSGGGGEGGAPFCEPGVVQPCYSGLPGTNDVGTCRAGSRVCNDDGAAYGPCIGEIAAITDACGAASCQGAAACGVSGLWSKGFEATGGQMGSVALVVDGQDDVIVAGYLAGEVDLGDGPMAVDSPLNGFVAKFNPAGDLLWSKRIGDDGAVWGPSDLAVTPSGNLVVMGYLNGGGVLDVAGTALVANGPADTVVIELSGDGEPLWAALYGGDGHELGTRLAIGPSGEVVVMGSFLDYGQDGNPAPGGGGVFLVELGASGQLAWERRFEVNPDDHGGGLAVMPWGDIVITGGFHGTADLGGGALPGQSGAFLARFDGLGNHLWSKSLWAEGASVTATDVLVSLTGELTITGTHDGPVDLGSGPLPDVGMQPFVARFTADGTPVWSRSLWGTETIASGQRLAWASGGDVLAGGTFSKLSDVNEGIAAEDVFVSRLGPMGEPLWGVAYGGPISQYLTDIAVDGAGDVLLTGAFDGSVDFGTGPLSASPNHLDLFVAKVAP